MRNIFCQVGIGLIVFCFPKSVFFLIWKAVCFGSSNGGGESPAKVVGGPYGAKRTHAHDLRTIPAQAVWCQQS